LPSAFVYAYPNWTISRSVGTGIGGHATRPDDFERLLEFAEWHFFNRPPKDREEYWRSPFSLPSEFTNDEIRRPIRSTVESKETEFIAPPATPPKPTFRSLDDDLDDFAKGKKPSIDEEVALIRKKLPDIGIDESLYDHPFRKHMNADFKDDDVH